MGVGWGSGRKCILDRWYIVGSQARAILAASTAGRKLSQDDFAASREGKKAPETQEVERNKDSKQTDRQTDRQTGRRKDPTSSFSGFEDATL